MPITLLDELALEKQPLRKGIIQGMLEQVTIQDRIPWETTDSLHMMVTRLSSIPRIPLRLINEVPSQVKSTHTQSTETLFILETDIDIDPVLLMPKNQVMSLEVVQTKGASAGIGYQVNDLFINADTALDIREPQGLKARLRDDIRFAQGTINATANSTKQDFSPDATDANTLIGLDKLDELHMSALRGHTSAFISNQQFILRMWSALRRLRMLDTTRDQFDREINMYRKVPILDIGYKPESAISGVPDATTVELHQIIGYDADDYDAGNDPGPGNGANAYTDTNTVYGVVWNKDSTEGLTGLQIAPLKVDPIGKTQEAPHFYRTNIQWVFNPCVPLSIRSVGRLIGLQLT